ncbi:MmgE/PrpD family protein [Ramlibacter sp.]|uniref:MmgE/PrpD family protein n=1 Tax=Ramlibacter sp. TaxID=1917967 RepID=UPI003D0BCB83
MPHASPAASDLRRLTRRLLAIDAGELPAPVVDRVRLCLLDMVACSLEAADLPWSRQAHAVAAAQGAHGVAGVIGSDLRTSAAEAAFVNGVQAHGLVREDMHPPSTSHIGVVVLPAALAMAEAEDADGAAFVAAVVAGYEAMGRLGRVVVDRQSARVFRPTAWIGPFGAAMAASRLLRLDESQAIHAAAFACNQAAGLNQWAYAMSTEVFFHAGFAARGGITAALLASQGAVGAESTLEGPAGLVAALGGRERLPLFAQDAAAPLEIEHVYFKPAPVCHFAQTPCQVAARIAETAPLSPEAVERVEVRVSAAAAGYPGCDNRSRIDALLAAKSSIQHGVALALLHGIPDEARVRDFADARVARLRQRIDVRVDDDLTRASPKAEGAAIAVHRRDGTQHFESADSIVPLDDAGVLTRFRDTATRHLGAEAAAAIEDLTADLRAVRSIRDLTRLFQTPTRRLP